MIYSNQSSDTLLFLFLLTYSFIYLFIHFCLFFINLSSLQTSIRKANLDSKTIIDKSEKEELLGRQSSSNMRQRLVKNKGDF